MQTRTTAGLIRFLAILSAAAFLLNWTWEVAQVQAYADMAGHEWFEAVLPCGLSSLGDVLITLGIYGIGALAAGDLRWGVHAGWNVYATGAFLGAVSAVGVECWGIASGRWSYGNEMPIVPVLKVGLWPFLQLTLLVPGATWIASRFGPRPLLALASKNMNNKGE